MSYERVKYSVERGPPKARTAKSGRYTVRLWDMFDGWMDLSKNLSWADAVELWLERTDGGQSNEQNARTVRLLGGCGIGAMLVVVFLATLVYAGLTGHQDAVTEVLKLGFAFLGGIGAGVGGKSWWDRSQAE